VQQFSRPAFPSIVATMDTQAETDLYPISTDEETKTSCSRRALLEVVFKHVPSKKLESAQPLAELFQQT
jgi:hypothetical protein